MNEQIIFSNLQKSIRNADGGNINTCSSLFRDLDALVQSRLPYHKMNPALRKAALLSLISVAGGLIVVTEEGYRCTNGFIDSFGLLYRAENPVCQNLELMEEEYISDSYFIEKAFGYLGIIHQVDAVDNLRKYCALFGAAYKKCMTQEDKTRIDCLRITAEALSNEITETEFAQYGPEAWDHEKWLREFLPIWNSRNRHEQHAFRAKYYKKHIALVQKRCYISRSGKTVQLQWDADERMHASRLYSAEITPAPAGTVYDTTVEIWMADCLDAAKWVQNETEGRTAVLNLANRQTPGGGVFTGSGAQEESCFLRSDYFTAMYPFAEFAGLYHLPRAKEQYPLDRDFGGVWSSGVTVFRGRELEGYPLLDEPWKTNFIAVPAINHPALVEENGESRLRSDMVQGALNKIRTVMNIAADNQVTNLVLGAMGCGAFKNPPKHIAELFRQVLEEPAYKGRFHRIIFAIINEELCETFAKVFGTEVK